MEKPKETILEAFLRQTEIKDSSADSRDNVLNRLSEHFSKKANKDIKHGPQLRDVVSYPTQKPNLGIKEHNSFNDLVVEVLNISDPQPGKKGFLDIDRLTYLRNKKASI